MAEIASNGPRDGKGVWGRRWGRVKWASIAGESDEVPGAWTAPQAALSAPAPLLWLQAPAVPQGRHCLRWDSGSGAGCLGGVGGKTTSSAEHTALGVGQSGVHTPSPAFN